jgi:paraquat-inducible protein A
MTAIPAEELIACHECDHVYRCDPIPPGARADCVHCGAVLYRHVPDSLNRSIALYLSALILFFVANCFPFLTLKLSGRIVENVLISSAWALAERGMPELGVLVVLTSIVFPFVVIAGMLYLLIPARLGQAPPAMGQVYRLVNAVTPWSLVGVFMLGVLIAIVKLQDLATIVTGVSVYALAALLIVYSAARASFEPRVLWEAADPQRGRYPVPRPDEPVLNCHTCALLTPVSSGKHRCPRCSAPLHFRKEDSINRTWALIFSATLLLIPANVYPVMTVIRFGQGDPDTILSGVMKLISGGMWGLALIVFFASIVVPVLKLIVLSFLLISIRNRSHWRLRDRTFLYRVTETVGAWSMVDIYLVGLLAALVSLDALSTIRPEPGAIFFAGVVVITMFAARTFDPRLIWDSAGPAPAAED